MSQEIKESSDEQFYLGISHKAAFRCWLRLQSSEGMIGPDVQVGSFAWLAVNAGQLAGSSAWAAS